MLQIEGLYDPPKNSQESKSDWLEDLSSQEDVGSPSFPKRNKCSHTQKYPPGVHIITKLTAGVRDQNRVNVFINGKYTLSLDSRQVIDLHIKTGQKISEAELQELHQASTFGKLYQRALEWVLMRPRSVQETRNYLRQRQIKRIQNNRARVKQELKPLPEIQDTTAQLVLERLLERGYVDDQHFTEFYIENRFIKKGISSKRLHLELRQKGISENIIANALNQSERNDDTELAKVVAKKARRYDHDKLIAYLCRQGFQYQDVVEAVESYEQNLDNSSTT